MKLNTNIVLTSNQGSTQPYVLQLLPLENKSGEFMLYQNDSEIFYNGNVYLYSKDNQKQLFRDVNDWYDLNWDGTVYDLNKVNIRLYFPQYSVDIFKPKTKYILSLSTHIHGKDIELGNFLFERKDAFVCAPVRFNGMDEYYEYMDFTIADPYSIYSIYPDIQSEALKEIFKDNDTTNGSLIYACLYVVEENDNHYIKTDDWTGGQNSIFVHGTNDLRANLQYNNMYRTLDIRVLFNEEYYNNLLEYIQSTYNVKKVGVIVQYVILDDENVYYEQSKLVSNINAEAFSFRIDVNEGSILDERAKRPSFSFDFNESFDSYITPYKEQIDGRDYNFFDTLGDLMNNGTVPKGLNIRGSVMFFRPIDSEDFPFLSVVSNRLYFTQDLISQTAIVKDSQFSCPGQINLDELDMNTINLKVINKITQEVNVITPTDSTKNHILQPVFYQTRNVSAVTIHPTVTENIAINLDSYKSQVNRFKIQVEGVVFKEIGRTNQGVIFKVVGNMLPKENNEGTLFVLNEDNELITTGKYSYLF